MNRWVWIVVAGIGLFVGGCSLAPEYTRPAAPVPAEWSRTTADAGTPEAAGLDWEDYFADPRLRRVVAQSLENNRDLRLAALNVERARALYGVQRAELFPAVNAAGAGAKQRRSADLISPGEPRTVESYGVDLGVAAWEIDFFGRIRSLKDQALESYLATAQARRSAQIALVAETARTWLTLAADRENLRLARSTLETQRASYALVRKSVDIGLATDIDLRRAQTQVDAARAAVPRYRQQVAMDRNALDLLAGGPVSETLLAGGLADVAPLAQIAPGLPSETLLQRPDIIAAEHRLKAANAFIGAARAAFFPRISLTAAVGSASDDLSGLFTSGSDTWNFAPKIVMPIFDARTWAALRVSRADRKIVLAEYEKAIQTAFREVADALAVQEYIDAQVEAQQSLVAATADTHRLARKRYETGLDNYLSVLDAQRSLYAQQQVEISLRLSRLANRVRLYAVLGGGGQ